MNCLLPSISRHPGGRVSTCTILSLCTLLHIGMSTQTPAVAASHVGSGEFVHQRADGNVADTRARWRQLIVWLCCVIPCDDPTAPTTTEEACLSLEHRLGTFLNTGLQEDITVANLESAMTAVAELLWIIDESEFGATELCSEWCGVIHPQLEGLLHAIQARLGADSVQ